jgi:hypothetical protein
LVTVIIPPNPRSIDISLMVMTFITFLPIRKPSGFSTIDYIILLKGDVSLLLDEDEVRLKPFDVVVQRGTNHAWVNLGEEPALLIAVLIDSDLKE